MKLTTESTVVNDNKLNTNIDNAQSTANDAKEVAGEAKDIASSAQGTAEDALEKANGSVATDTLHYLATSQGSGVTINTPGWTTTPQTITSENKYLWTYHTYTKADGTFTNSYPVITGTYGENGTSVTILGSYDTLAELEQAHPTGNLGDAYLVGGDLYVWNGTAWEDVGQIQGPEGPQGPQGDTGVGISAVQPQYYLSTSPTTATGGTWSTELIYDTGKYIWTRERVLYTNGNISYSTEIYNNALTTACETAEAALRIASDTAQYFWFTSSGTDTGAHISNKTQADFISNPTGGNLLARSNGIAVRDGLTEMATFSGTQARIGKTSSSNVTITDLSITMSDGTRTVYKVANNTSGNIKVTRILNKAFSKFTINTEDAIPLGRTVSSWVANGIILKYKVNNTNYTKTYSDLPSYDSTGKYLIDATLNGTTVVVELGRGDTAQDSETITFVSLEFNFITTQQSVESTLGAYANATQSGVFRIGNGTASNSLANAMLVDWAGNAMFGGDVVAYANADSSGGLSLTDVEYVPSVFNWESADGTAFMDLAMYRMGRIVVLELASSRAASVAAGGNIFDARLSGVRIPQPVTMGGTTGASYYGNHSIAFNLFYEDYWHFRVRNASPSAVTPSDMLTGTLMYICDIDPVTHAIRYTND